MTDFVVEQFTYIVLGIVLGLFVGTALSNSQYIRMFYDSADEVEIHSPTLNKINWNKQNKIYLYDIDRCG